MAHGTSFDGFNFGLQSGDSSGSQFVLAAQSDNAAAFRQLVHSYDTTVMRVALALTGSQGSAQEIYFRVFRDAFTSIRALKSSTSMFVWLYRILVKHCIAYCRRNRDYSAKTGSHSLAEALCALPPKERVIFLLKHSQGLKISTIAEIFESPPERIAGILQSATIRLRAQFKAQLNQVA